LKPSAGAAGAEVIPAELLQELLVAVDDAASAAHLRFGGVSPSSAYWRPRKDGRLSKSSSLCMTHLLFMGAGSQAAPLGGRVCQSWLGESTPPYQENAARVTEIVFWKGVLRTRMAS